MANYKDEAIYVIGGRGGPFDKSLDSVLAFNLETHKFKNCAKLNEARYHCSSTIAGETIYVFGGFSGYNNNHTNLDSIEALDVSSP